MPSAYSSQNGQGYEIGLIDKEIPSWGVKVSLFYNW